MAFQDYIKDIPFVGELVNKPKVSVLRLSGIIADSGMRKTSLSLHRLLKSIDKAFDVYNAKAVCLAINSPGGSPAQSSLIANYIRQKSEEKELPVLAFVEDVAASGGYWLACAADEIYAQDSSIVGSIGVVSASFGLDELIGEYKISRRLHTSGKDKAFLDPFLPEQEKDVKRLKSIQKDLHEHFIDWIKQRRGEKLKGKDAQLFEGAFWTAGQAESFGLIDGVADLYAFSKTRFGEDVRFVDLSPEKGLLSNLVGTKASVAEDIVQIVQNKQVWSRYGL